MCRPYHAHIVWQTGRRRRNRGESSALQGLRDITLSEQDFHAAHDPRLNMLEQDCVIVQAIQVVDPSNLTLVTNITRDQDGQPLNNEGANGGSASTSRSWNDAVLAQVKALRVSHYARRAEPV